MLSSPTLFARRALRCAVASVLAVSLSIAPASGQSLEQAENQADELRTDVEVLLTELESALGMQEAAQSEVDQLTTRRDELTAKIDVALVDLQNQVRRRFMLGTSPAFAVLLSSGRSDIAQRASLLAVLESRQLGALQEAEGLRGSLDSVEIILEDRLEDLARLTADLASREAEVSARLVRVSRVVDELRSRKARQTAISRGAQNGTYACIMDRGNYHYINSWGAPRSGGRSHKGTDVMAPRGVNVYAFTTGRVERIKTVDRGLGGIVLYLRGDDGHRYYYAHLESFAAGIYAGKRVEAGELIAYNGSTGNAAYSAPHVHFEVHPGGGSAANPYYWLTPVCT
ncbi:MAG: murein DD-endopeptidase MepM/ murein hydrolase activator NlpD [Glaciecola sp.]